MYKFENILLIDDDPIFNVINEAIIDAADFGKPVKSYCDANDAIRDLKKGVDGDGSPFPEIVFLDINMPHMDGWEFLDAINTFPEHIVKKCKVFMLTSSIDQNDITKSKAYPTVQGFISKPLTIEGLDSLFPKMIYVA